MSIQYHNKYVLFALTFSILTIFAYTDIAQDRDDPLFATEDLENELCAKFGLKPKEIDALRPLILLDNRNAALLYIKATDDHATDYMFLWEKVRRSNAEFETSLTPALTRMQRRVLRAAHLEFETRILTMWMDDYIGTLADAVDLDNVQVSVARVIFDVDSGHRRRLLAMSEAIPDREFGAKWDRMTKEREEQLLKILSRDQIRAYRFLTTPLSPWIASTFTAKPPST